MIGIVITLPLSSWIGVRNPSSFPAETALLSSGDCLFLNFGPEDLGDAQEVPAVEVVLAGDHV
jgi:hypothetical protein